MVAIAAAVIGVAGGRVPLVVWGVAVGGMAVAATLWARSAWKDVTIIASFLPSRAFIDEPLALRIRIVNGKSLPLPLVRLGIWLPLGLLPEGGLEGSVIRGFHRRIFIHGNSEAILDLPVTPLRRGEHWLERVEVELADPFDLVPLRREVEPDAVVMVMPQPRLPIPVDIRRRLPFGAPARAARMFEARERFAGVRPYEPGDPLNRIHWRLTGHTGGLQVKLFEPTRTADVVAFLDLAVGEPFWDGVYPEIAEDTIGWAAFLARQAIGAGWRVGLVANTHLTRGRGPLRVPPAEARGHEAAIFAALARMPNEPTSDLAPVLRETGRRMGRDSTALVLTPRSGPRLRHEMVVLRRRGVHVIELSPLAAFLARARTPA